MLPHYVLFWISNYRWPKCWNMIGLGSFVSYSIEITIDLIECMNSSNVYSTYAKFAKNELSPVISEFTLVFHVSKARIFLFELSEILDNGKTPVLYLSAIWFIDECDAIRTEMPILAFSSLLCERARVLFPLGVSFYRQIFLFSHSKDGNANFGHFRIVCEKLDCKLHRSVHLSQRTNITRWHARLAPLEPHATRKIVSHMKSLLITVHRVTHVRFRP